jgi:SOS response regulatory protein OraA/RecX
MDRAGLLRHAVSLLANRPHSSAELATKLTRVTLRQRARAELAHAEAAAAAPLHAPPLAPLPPPRAGVAAIISELEGAAALDDGAYAAWHTAQRAASRPRSRLQLLQELSAKRVDGDTARAAVAAGHDELAACATQALRRGGLSTTRLRVFLTNKGFARSCIDRVLEARASGVECLQALRLSAPPAAQQQ